MAAPHKPKHFGLVLVNSNQEIYLIQQENSIHYTLPSRSKSGKQSEKVAALSNITSTTSTLNPNDIEIDKQFRFEQSNEDQMLIYFFGRLKLNNSASINGRGTKWVSPKDLNNSIRNAQLSEAIVKQINLSSANQTNNSDNNNNNNNATTNKDDTPISTQHEDSGRNISALDLKKFVVHCKKSPYDVYIGRPNPTIPKHKTYNFKWGNPFKIGPDSDR